MPLCSSFRWRWAFVGAGVVLLPLLSAGAASVPALVRVEVAAPVEVVGLPTPDQMVRVVEGQPYVVPDGSLFVVTGLGSTGAGTATPDKKDLFVQFDDEVVYAARIWQTGPAVPPGLVASSGISVSVREPHSGGTQEGVLLGYVVDA